MEKKEDDGGGEGVLAVGFASLLFLSPIIIKTARITTQTKKDSGPGAGSWEKIQPEDSIGGAPD